MPKQKLSKNLPKRCVNEHLKNRRQKSWQRGEDRKKARQAAQKKAEQTNRLLRAQGNLTSWEQIKAKVRAARGPMLHGPEDRKTVAGTTTSYVDIRRSMDRFLGQQMITVNYLDQVHRYWTTLGKGIAKGSR